MILRKAGEVLCIAFAALSLLACASGNNDVHGADGDATDEEFSTDGDTTDGDAEWIEREAEEEAFDDDSSETETPSNRALVFPVDPVATPQAIYVELSAADDQSGALISAADKNGLRRLAAYSCADEGATNTINVGQGPVEQRICTLVKRANKNVHGNFVYEDYAQAVAGEFDTDDVHAEVEAFYHAAKFYDFFTAPEVGLFDTIPRRHGEENLPINLVTNYQLPALSGAKALTTTHSAMYFPKENLALGMGMVYGISGLQGDIITLGQGNSADFAYDGQTVYHEMGHLMNRALANLSYTISVDSYGMNALENALEQGLAETMTFLVSGRSGMFGYINALAGPGFFRDADNSLRYPDDYCGVDQADAMILAGAMWDTFSILKKAGLTTPKFTRLLLLSMQSLDASSAELSFADWVRAFLSAMEKEGYEAQKEAIAAAFDERGLSVAERVRPLVPNADGFMLYVGGAYQAMWNSVLTLELDTGDLPVSTARIQLKAGPFDREASCTLTAKPVAVPGSAGMYPATDDWDLRLLARSGEALRYEKRSSWRAGVKHDALLDTQIGEAGSVVFSLHFAAGEVLYLHLINAGDSPMFLSSIRLLCP